MNELVNFVDAVIEEYKDGRVSTSYQMLSLLNQIKTKAQEAQA